MRTVNVFRAPTAYEEEMLKAQRQQQLAEMLRQQAEAPEQEYTFQGFRAMPSLAGGLARVLKSYGARKAEERADEAARAAREADVAGAEELQRALAPQTRSITGGALPETDVTGMASAYQPEMAQQPMMETVAPTAQQRRDLLTQYAVRGTPTAQRLAQVLAGQEPKTSTVEFGDQLLNVTDGAATPVMMGGKPVTAKPKQNMPSSYEEFLLASTNPAYAQFINDNKGNKTIVLPGDKTRNLLADEFSKGIAAQDLETVKAGDAALAQIETANNVRDLLKQNPITGTGASERLAFEKALATAGFTSGDRASITENLSANLAKATLSLVRTSGLGAGQGFTDSDRKFLEKAAAGQIEMSNKNLQYLADLNDKAARANISRSNAVRARYRKLPNFSSMPDMLPDIVAPPVYGSQLPAGARLDQ